MNVHQAADHLDQAEARQAERDGDRPPSGPRPAHKSRVAHE